MRRPNPDGTIDLPEESLLGGLERLGDEVERRTCEALRRASRARRLVDRADEAIASLASPPRRRRRKGMR